MAPTNFKYYDVLFAWYGPVYEMCVYVEYVVPGSYRGYLQLQIIVHVEVRSHTCACLDDEKPTHLGSLRLIPAIAGLN